MIFIQLDKNTGDKRFKAACMDERIVDCDLLPRRVRDKEDDEVLEYVIEQELVIFTFDNKIHFDWGSVLCGRNPGIIILRQDQHVLQQINTKTAPRHLKRFKKSFPQWHTVPYRNSVLELTPTLMFLYHTMGTRPERVYWSKWCDPGWQVDLVKHFQANANGTPLRSNETPLQLPPED